MPSTNRRFNVKKSLQVNGKKYGYYSLKEAEKELGSLERMPFTLKVLLENLLRFEDGASVKADDIKALAEWAKNYKRTQDIAYRPARVLMQDFTGVPAIVDLAAMRQAMVELGGNPKVINPLSPVDLVIDHSVMVDKYANADAFHYNVQREFERNKERYTFLRWGQGSFDNFRVVPPGTGICHQVNLEYLGKVVWTSVIEDEEIAYPDTLVGTDSHTTMVNGLAVLGWGVGGIEAEAAMLGQPVSMEMPEVVGFKLTGALKEGATATDLVLTVTQMLRQEGVVGKFVEFYGNGLDQLSLADRATISNMAPEYGATCGFFPIDKETLNYLSLSARDPQTIALVEAYAKEQGLWRNSNTPDPHFSSTLTLDLAMVEPSLAGPKRPQDRVKLSHMKESCRNALEHEKVKSRAKIPVTRNGRSFEIGHGAVVIAAITSCTNTSNPSVMIAAGLLAQKAVAKGLKVKPWVKTSLAPGSQVVSDYLNRAGLQKALDQLGFDLVGYGCTTCIGNSGPLDEPISQAINKNDLAVGAVLSGNRNFEGRVHPQVKLNYLASPPLVVAYALAGSLDVDLNNDPLGYDQESSPVYLKDIWPTTQEIKKVVMKSVTRDMFLTRYKDVFKGDKEWRSLFAGSGLTYEWEEESAYAKLPPFFNGMKKNPEPIRDIIGARALAILGDSVTTDHISPAGSIKRESPAGDYLIAKGVSAHDFNSYGARRGNHEVMMRGTFANIRLTNEMVPGVSGGYTKFMPEGTEMSIYEAAMLYTSQNTPLVIIGGKEYGTGSSRDWAAKGTRLLGVKAVVVESFERIHRSNLIGMGVIPLQFKGTDNRKSLKLTGEETFDIKGLEKGLKPKMEVQLTIHYPDKTSKTIDVLCRLDTQDEVIYYENGGILHYVLRNLLKTSTDGSTFGLEKTG